MNNTLIVFTSVSWFPAGGIGDDPLLDRERAHRLPLRTHQTEVRTLCLLEPYRAAAAKVFDCHRDILVGVADELVAGACGSQRNPATAFDSPTDEVITDKAVLSSTPALCAVAAHQDSCPAILESGSHDSGGVAADLHAR